MNLSNCILTALTEGYHISFNINIISLITLFPFSHCLCVVSNMSCHSTATINNLLREGHTVNTRTSICSKSVLFTTLFTHFCFCGGSSDVFRESDKGYFSPTLSCYFPGSFVWLRDLSLSVLRGMRGTFEHDHLWTLQRSYTDGSHTCVCVYMCAYLHVCVFDCHLVLGLSRYIPAINSRQVGKHFWWIYIYVLVNRRIKTTHINSKLDIL